MTTKPLSGYRLDAKGKLVKKAPRMTGPLRKRLEGKAKREADKWIKKSRKAV